MHQILEHGWFPAKTSGWPLLTAFMAVLFLSRHNLDSPAEADSWYRKFILHNSCATCWKIFFRFRFPINFTANSFYFRLIGGILSIEYLFQQRRHLGWIWQLHWTFKLERKNPHRATPIVTDRKASKWFSACVWIIRGVFKKFVDLCSEINTY